MPRKSDAPLRVGIYSRVSTDHQTTENQERELQAIAERIGWTVVKVYRDQGVSGAKSRQDRPAFDALCKDASRRQFDLVAAWSVDRLGRSLQDLVGFPDRETCSRRQPIPASARRGHHHSGWQGPIPADGRVRRI